MDSYAIEPYQEGSKWYLREGHYFVLTRTRRHILNLRCAEIGCEATWRHDNILNIIEPIRGMHNHMVSTWIRERNKMFQSLRNRSTAEQTALNTIYEEEVLRHPNAAPHLLYDSVAPSMRRWRRSVQPPIPHTMEEFAGTVSNIYLPNYIGLVSAAGSSAVILGMERFGECMQNSEIILADGTFQTVPRSLPAAQLLTIHVVIQGHYFSPIVALMQNRTRLLYDAVFNFIWRSAGEPAPQYVISDYEPALQGALQQVSRVRVQGCFFHYSQALIRRARQMRMVMRQGEGEWRLVQLYIALALLPANQIPAALNTIQEIAVEQGFTFNDRYHDYYTSYWINRFGAATFSVFGANHRTSNIAESFHAALQRSMRPNPNAWQFMDSLRAKFATQTSRFTALQEGNLVRRNAISALVRRQELRQNEMALQNQMITLKDFLLTVSGLLDRRILIAAENVPEVGAEVVLGEPDLQPLRPQVVHREPAMLPADDIPDLPEVQLAGPEDAEVVDELAEIAALPAVQPIPPQVEQIANREPTVEIPNALPPTDNFECAICVNARKEVALIPCGHLVCRSCSFRLTGYCPFCRQIYNNTLTIYPD